ncbi:hypothetical protein CH339_12275 [Rhodobium orientis]|uniref:Protein-L-isoaspartate O-methyltransferase n=1 Tax=Rhodobium orientis TaxID=34017 RepID=A0A327JKY9_9HYPH|nr:hypothetical protein [Rhodobium orientis]RAI26957.1 hypothetical protein CH339_12275 [Rhodobium orientis]
MRYPRHEFVERFKFPGEHFMPPVERGTTEFLPGGYQNRPLMYVKDDGSLYEASSSEPAFIFHLAQLLNAQDGQSVLEIGCGTGWLVAVLSHLVGARGTVVGVEIQSGLARQAARNIKRFGIENAEIIEGNAFENVGQRKFDRVIVTASMYDIPSAVIDILQEGGLAILPIRSRGLPEEVHLLRKVGSCLTSETTRLCKFVAMVDPDGTTEDHFQPLDRNATYRAHCADANIERELTFDGASPKEMLWRALPFTSYLAKVDAGFRQFVVGRIGTTITSHPIFGDPSWTAFGLAYDREESLAVWHAGRVTRYGAPTAFQSFLKHYDDWCAVGKPSGFAFGLAITANGSAPHGGVAGRFREDRADVSLWWHLRPQEERL